MDESRVALVTDGMGTLGTAVCRRLAAAGFRVAAVHGRGEQAPQAWLAARRDEGGRLYAYQVDASDYADAEWTSQRVLAELGRIDVLVNNGGVLCERSLQQMSADDWHTVLRSNLDSVFNMSKQAIEPMAERGWGRIINISSVQAQSGAYGQSHFAAAKAGIHGLSKSLALEVARFGITVNTVSPGQLRGCLAAGHSTADLEMDAATLSAIPLGRLGEPDEVAALVAYLASDEAGFITGANLAINGGQHMC